jgi:lysophospholipase L1-like esterase
MSRHSLRAINAACRLALLAFATSATLQADTPPKKHTASSTTASGKASATKHSPTSRSHLATARRRVYPAAPHLDSTHRAALVEEISARLKEPAPHAISYEAALDGFYAQLASHENARHDGAAVTETVRVLQWGDSHTAADMFTGEARRTFQQQFGDGGIGYSYAGHPFAGYRILGSTRAQSPDWRTEGNKFRQLDEGAELGMGGISISTNRAGEWVTLDAPCTELDLQYLEQPGGGSLRFTDNDGDPTEIQTDAPQAGAGTFHYNCSAGDHHFKVTTESSAPVTLLGWVATQPGVTWESIGINGAEAPLILKWDPQIFAQYLKDNSPALIVLAYGTNEAASPEWGEENYRQAFASIIDMLHKNVPESSILVVGPTDRFIFRRHAWRAYDGADKIIAAQKAVCRTEGCAYWDQLERMGGLGSMQQWVSAGWAQPDHTHFTGDGYRALANALIADLMAGYERYKEQHSSNTETAIQGATLGATRTNP